METTKNYRIILACRGIPNRAANAAALEIAREFRHRPQHKNVACAWDGSRLILQAENDFDSSGLALLDEFSDAISACVPEPFDGDIQVISVTLLESGLTKPQ